MTQTRMRAITQDRYGSTSVLALREVARPAIGDEQVLVRVHAAAVNPGDVFSMRGVPYVLRPFLFGLRRPKRRVLGWDLAGTVVEVGARVSQYRPGEAVYGTGESAFAEYAVVAPDRLAAKPERLTFEQAAAVPTAGLAALHGLRDAGGLRSGQRVLINGAAGGVGTFAVQIAKALGAEVTGVCSSRNVELVRSLGADHVIDYTREDFTEGAPRYDLILDNVANHPLSRLRRVLAPTGTVLPNNGEGGRWFGPLGRLAYAVGSSVFSRQKARAFVSNPNPADLLVLAQLIDAGKVTPVIDRSYRLDQVPEAIAHVEAGHARGKVVVTI